MRTVKFAEQWKITPDNGKNGEVAKIRYVSRKVNLIFTLRSNRKFCFKNDGSNSLNILSVVIIELVINTLVKDSAFQEYYEFHLCKQNYEMMRIVTDSFYAV